MRPFSVKPAQKNAMNSKTTERIKSWTAAPGQRINSRCLSLEDGWNWGVSNIFEGKPPDYAKAFFA